jgi:dTMP kinase
MGKRLKRGVLITFEGTEGSGKSTQIRYTANLLRRKGYSVVTFREPGGTDTSEAIRKILLDKKLHKMGTEAELLLYLAARAQLVREEIEPALKQGKIVVLDRYEDSTLAYQGFAGGIPLRLIQGLSRFVRGRIVPRLTFLLDIETKKGLRRSGRNDRVEKKSLSFHQKVRRGFLALARREPRRFVILSSHDSIQQVQQKIARKIDALF